MGQRWRECFRVAEEAAVALLRVSIGLFDVTPPKERAGFSLAPDFSQPVNQRGNLSEGLPQGSQLLQYCMYYCNIINTSLFLYSALLSRPARNSRCEAVVWLVAPRSAQQHVQYVAHVWRMYSNSTVLRAALRVAGL
jgi:hypothetical protein